MTEHTGDSTPQTMRAALLTGIGGPEMLEVRNDAPVPRAGPGDVVVRVGACGVNNTDINTRVGWYSRSISTATEESGYRDADPDDVGWSRKGLAFPRIQGSDVVGVVVEVGEGAGADLMGRRVMVDPCLRNRSRPDNPDLAGYLGSERDGGFAEYCSVPGENAYPISIDIPDVELAAFPCSWSTAEHMLQLGRVHTNWVGFGMVGGWRLLKSSMSVWRVVSRYSAAMLRSRTCRS